MSVLFLCKSNILLLNFQDNLMLSWKQLHFYLHGKEAWLFIYQAVKMTLLLAELHVAYSMIIIWPHTTRLRNSAVYWVRWEGHQAIAVVLCVVTTYCYGKLF